MKSETVKPAINDNQRIDARNPLELATLANSLDATPDEIKSAIAEVGSLREKVIEHLSKL